MSENRKSVSMELNLASRHLEEALSWFEDGDLPKIDYVLAKQQAQGCFDLLTEILDKIRAGTGRRSSLPHPIAHLVSEYLLTYAPSAEDTLVSDDILALKVPIRRNGLLCVTTSHLQQYIRTVGDKVSFTRSELIEYLTGLGWHSELLVFMPRKSIGRFSATTRKYWIQPIA